MDFETNELVVHFSWRSETLKSLPISVNEETESCNVGIDLNPFDSSPCYCGVKTFVGGITAVDLVCSSRTIEVYVPKRELFDELLISSRGQPVDVLFQHHIDCRDFRSLTFKV